MKHLNHFIPIKKYWLVPKFNDDIFKIALLKINCDKNYIKLLMEIAKNDSNNLNNYIFVGYNSDEDSLNTKGWDWMSAPQGLKKLYNKVFETDGYEFSGIIKVEDYEISAHKYNI
jgi:hypothetical protein